MRNHRPTLDRCRDVMTQSSVRCTSLMRWNHLRTFGDANMQEKSPPVSDGQRVSESTRVKSLCERPPTCGASRPHYGRASDKCAVRTFSIRLDDSAKWALEY